MDRDTIIWSRDGGVRIIGSLTAEERADLIMLR